MRPVLFGLVLCTALFTSCATTSRLGPKASGQGPGLVRKLMEHPMSGKQATEPIADSLARITTRTSPDHIGTDFTAHKQALPVFAAKEGLVLSNTTAGSSSGAATITVLNSDGSVSRYLHIGSSVQPGDGLTIGEPLGLVLLPGQPGYGATNTGAHLHYEQYLDQARFEKRQYMTTDEVIAQWTD